MAVRRLSRTGFTLVEVLVVILIITILIALLVPALGYAVRRGEQMAYVSDLKAIEMALEGYREKYGDYPPDFSDAWDGSPAGGWNQTVAYRHIRKTWQRIAPEELAFIGAINWRSPDDPIRIDAAEAVVFWLGGLSSNPRYPFTGEGGPLIRDGDNWMWRIEGRMNALLDIRENRLGPDPDDPQRGLNPALGPVFLPGRGKFSPYVYFDARTYAIASYMHPLNSEAGIALPYWGRTDRFVNPETYQVLSAGTDDFYAPHLVIGGSPVYTSFPLGQPVHPNHSLNDPIWTSPPHSEYFRGQDDNMTSFSEGRVLGDVRDQ
jgi:prepilin-type N-terminal cleavage/methylation domain-containing protein